MPRADYEYGGIHTALNGLLNWVYNHVNPPGNADERCATALKIIVEYGEKNIPGFKKKGHALNMADYIARKIHRNRRFNTFSEWVKKEYIIP